MIQLCAVGQKLIGMKTTTRIQKKANIHWRSGSAGGQARPGWSTLRTKVSRVVAPAAGQHGEIPCCHARCCFRCMLPARSKLLSCAPGLASSQTLHVVALIILTLFFYVHLLINILINCVYLSMYGLYKNILSLVCFFLFFNTKLKPVIKTQW